jgi:predicted CxxxxCH...CXXCH cytochrome family protein
MISYGKLVLRLSAGVLLGFMGCVGTEKPANPQAVSGTVATAACDECHSYPGSALCKTDTLLLGHTAYTQCYACHLWSTALDSSYDTAAATYVFHDAVSVQNGKVRPSPGPLHADGSVSLNFAQCAFCHAYQPGTGAHKRHVVKEGKQCYECHFATAISDTQFDTLTGEMYFYPRMHTVPGGGVRPLLDRRHHINNSIEVSFRKKYQRPGPPADFFIYNRFDKSCSNVECHSGTENGGASFERTIWKDTLQ